MPDETASTRSFETGHRCPVQVDGEQCKVEGSIPGLKRHIAKSHGQDWKTFFPEEAKAAKAPKAEKAAKKAAPTTPASNKPLDEMSTKELQAAAKEAGVEGFHRMKKDDLLAALSEGASA